jgi:hypothetical protein
VADASGLSCPQKSAAIMVGPTAQLVALVCHFNGASRGLHPNVFFPSNSTSLFCEEILFLRQRRFWFRRGDWEIAARTPDEWLSRNAVPGGMALLSHRRTDSPVISDRMLAGMVGGGGRWRLNVVSGQRVDVWEASWAVGNRNAKDRRIWRVHYRLVDANARFSPPASPPLGGIIPAFRQSLTDILAFCEQQKIQGFCDCFRKAIACLSAEDPFALVYHKDLAPERLPSLSAQQVLAACQAAWVFGGMGSWNDLGFEGQAQAQYGKVSETLFSLLNDAITVAANSTASLEDKP